MGGHVYAIGGRTWGEDREAVLANCERYNISTSQWEPIAKMNHARFSSMAFQLRSKLYVLGGYKGDSLRWSDIEVYTPENNTWTILKVSLKIALEGSSLLMANRTGGIFLLGGRTDEGDTSKIWDFDVEQGDMWEIGNLKESKSLTKIYEFNEKKVFIMGGDKYMTELFDLTEGKSIESRLGNEISENLNGIVGRGRNVDNKLLRFGLA